MRATRHLRMEQVVRAAVEVETGLAWPPEIRAVPALAPGEVQVEVVHFLAQRRDHLRVLGQVVMQRARARLHRADDHRVRQCARLAQPEPQLELPARLEQAEPAQRACE